MSGQPEGRAAGWPEPICFFVGGCPEVICFSIFAAAAAAAGAPSARPGPQRRRRRRLRRRRRRPQKLKNKSPPDGRPSKKKLAPDGRPPGPPAGRTPKGTDEKKRKNQSVSQTIDQVMAINSVQKSSKSELSSRGKHPFKVYIYSLKLLAKAVRVRVALASLKVDRAENRFVKSRSR